MFRFGIVAAPLVEWVDRQAPGMAGSSSPSSLPFHGPGRDIQKRLVSCQNGQMKTILVLALDGVMDSSLAITLDTLRAGQALLSRVSKPHGIRVMTAGYKRQVRTGGGLRLQVDALFREIPEAGVKVDWVIVPGCGLVGEAEIVARCANRDAIELMRLLKTVDDGSVKIGASCSSVFFLAHAGLLDGRRATMTWWLAHIFRSRYPDITLDETKMLVRDGPYMTSGAAFSQLDLALAVVADTMGTTIAHLCSRYMLIDQRPSQARYMMPTHIQNIDPTVVAAERWIDAHLAAPISVAHLSSELAVSPKTLSRRIVAATGVSPIKFIQRRRLLCASHLIETTSMSIEAIAAKVGYQDGTALRKLIKREFGTTPGALR
jgi:transcriptional regulator GlxA family with amidase domain